MRRTIAAVDAGTYYHHASLHRGRFADAFDRIVYVRELATADLADIDTLIVTCRTDPAVLRPQAGRLRAFLDDGRTLVAMGSTGPHLWLPGVTWTDTPTNFWWWRTPGGDLGLEAAAPSDPFFEHVPLADAVWHHHGYFRPPEGARSLIDARGLGSVLYIDDVTTAGTMIVTALDPFYHHGSYFMPATTRFLTGFLPWLRAAPFAAAGAG